MARNKDKEFKDFLISRRRSTGPGLTNAPVWVLQKAGRRIWNPKGKRTWKDADFGHQFRTQKKRAARSRRRPKE